MAKLFADFSVNVPEKILKSNLTFLPLAVCFNDVNSVVFWESSGNRVVGLLLASTIWVFKFPISLGGEFDPDLGKGQ